MKILINKSSNFSSAVRANEVPRRDVSESVGKPTPLLPRYNQRLSRRFTFHRVTLDHGGRFHKSINLELVARLKNQRYGWSERDTRDRPTSQPARVYVKRYRVLARTLRGRIAPAHKLHHDSIELTLSVRRVYQPRAADRTGQSARITG